MSTHIDSSRLIGVADAAIRLRIPVRTVQWLLKRGRLPGERLGHKWVMRESNLAVFVADRIKRARKIENEIKLS
jgi:excisionase family DNA binding protein